MKAPRPDQLKFDERGLLVAVVQAAADGRILMVAHMNPEAYRLTLATGLAHFWSRSRHRLWKKGEESGNVLRVAAIGADCDGDALLLTAHPEGPTCHRGTRSCFDEVGERESARPRPGAPNEGVQGP